jgi:hypothetical protein
MTRRRVDLRIDRLVLDGLAEFDGRAVGRAVERDLARLLVRPGLPPALSRAGARHRIDAGSVATPAKGGADALGTEVAQAIHRGLKR